jgi:hypothetical protein
MVIADGLTKNRYSEKLITRKAILDDRFTYSEFITARMCAGKFAPHRYPGA